MRRVWAWGLVAACAVGCREGGERLENADAAFNVTPGTVNFGPTALGERHLFTVHVANRGAAPVVVTEVSSTLPLVEPVDASAFRLDSGDGRDLRIAFAPKVEGAVSGVLQLKTDHDALRAQVPVSGQGVSAFAEVRTTGVDFGGVELGTVKMGQVVVANPRAVPVQVVVTLGGADAASSSPRRRTRWSWRPARCARSRWRSSRGGWAWPRARPASPSAQAVPGWTFRWGDRHYLPARHLAAGGGLRPGTGGLPADAHVTVRNLGSQPFDFRGAALLNAPAGTFALTSVPSLPGGQLLPGATADLSLRFTPRASGPVSGVLLRIDAGPAGSNAPGPKLPVLGAGGTPCLWIAPSPLDFGTVPQGMTSTLPLEAPQPLLQPNRGLRPDALHPGRRVLLAARGRHARLPRRLRHHADVGVLPAARGD